MLIALMAGSAAHQAEETDNDTLVREVTERLSRTFAPKVVPIPSEVIVTRWKRDPFARGSYSYVGPRTQQGDYDVMARPCGPIHFAGEATCGSHPATVHGAYLSGLRAAEEVIDTMLGPIQVPYSPLVAPRVKAEPLSARSGPKRKFGYIDVWEPINKPDPFTASVAREKELEEYESLVYDVIRAEIGDRPVKPPKATLNPFILYTKDEWQSCKTELETQLAATKGKAGLKAARNDIRIALGAKWRNASQEVKQPYLDKCKDGKEFTAEAKAAYEASVLAWDQQAAKIRADFVRENKPPEASSGSPASGRKGRKVM
jgi:lysine-specific histone demethylase 1